MMVEAKWQDEHRGNIYDIGYFKPIQIKTELLEDRTGIAAPETLHSGR